MGISPLAIIAVALLAALSIAGVLFVILSSLFSGGGEQSKRLENLKQRNIAGDANNPQTRRRAVQDVINEMEMRQKAKADNAKKPPLRIALVQAGLKINTKQYYLFSALAAVVGAIGALLGGLPFYIAPGAAIVCGLGLPRFVVNFLRKRRQAKFIEALPDALEVLTRSIKAGLSFNDGMRMLSTEAREPIRSEFKQVTDIQQAGIPIDEALVRMCERMPVAEANFMTIAVSIQLKAGGNLSEALGNLAKVLRERKLMRGKIKALSAEAKSSAYIIGAMPILVTGLVKMSSPKYIDLLFTDQRGHLALLAAGIWMSMGIFVMRKMIQIDI